MEKLKLVLYKEAGCLEVPSCLPLEQTTYTGLLHLGTQSLCQDDML